jgi:hypothetical protein
VTDALRALRRVNLDWTAHIDQVWSNEQSDTESLQCEARSQLLDQLEDLTDFASERSPLGTVLVGAGGSGKTHLLGVLRRQAIERGATFVLVDMTDVKDFWEIVLLGYLRSLLQVGSNGQRQIDQWLTSITDHVKLKVHNAKDIPRQRPPKLINTCNELISAIRGEHREMGQEHADVLRALLLFACDHTEINDLGYKWLQGIGIDDSERLHFGFRDAQRSPSQIVRGLSWLLALRSPTVLCLDQLDAIVAEHNLAASAAPEDTTEQRNASLAIIQGISGGMMALRDVTQRTLTVVSSLEATWHILKERSAASMTDRFRDPILLGGAQSTDAIVGMVARRLSPGYRTAEFVPPYPSYPFPPAFFEKYKANTPREILKSCDQHRQRCRQLGQVVEAGDPTPLLGKPEPRSLEAIRRRVEELEIQANVEGLVADETERQLDLLIEAACQALLIETELPTVVHATVDKDFQTTGSYDPLHARIRLTMTHQGERERHQSFRFIQKQNHLAFQARLKAAVTASGIDKALSFRQLTILRVGSVPGGPATERLLHELRNRGGALLEPTHSELKRLCAISQLFQDDSSREQLEAWLKAERPVSGMPSFESAAKWLFADLGATAPPPGLVTSTPLPSVPAPSRVPTFDSAEIPLGCPSAQGADGEPLRVTLSSLTYHTCVLAGSGSGKTVLLRRIVEEAALLGVPSIVIDGANDLARLGDPWPKRPEAFTDDDERKAVLYRSAVETAVFTPGTVSGNPLVLRPIPDFSVLTTPDSADERSAAIDMALDSLRPLVAPGNGSKDKKAHAILKLALEVLAQRGHGSIEELIPILAEPPESVTEGFQDGAKIAGGLGELLRSAKITDPMLRTQGIPLDPARLLETRKDGRTRISVINLGGLSGLLPQQQFINQLAMTLFTWIKRHPAPTGSILGLLVIDEAKDFIPSGKSVACKENLIRLVAQARKYGLGLLFATQAPKSIDHNIVANCSTLIVGRTNSPTAISTVQELLHNKGGAVSDVGRLGPGTFYASTLAHPKPVKLSTPLCLSYHPSNPLDQDQVLERARQSVTMPR